MSEWISVEDRLPINCIDELVDKNYSDVEVIVNINGVVATAYFMAGKTVGFWGSFTVPNVTHWQPLPEPPL